jgi:hypothetical protein
MKETVSTILSEIIEHSKLEVKKSAVADAVAS